MSTIDAIVLRRVVSDLATLQAGALALSNRQVGFATNDDTMLLRDTAGVFHEFWGSTRIATEIQAGIAATDHNDLAGRSDNDCHPVSAVTGLTSALAGKVSKSGDTMSGALNVTVGGQTTTIGGGVIQVTLNPDTTETTPGIYRWNALDNTPEVTLVNGSVGQLFQENHLYSMNNTGGDLTEGTVVQLSGSSGQRATIGVANSADSTASSTIGMLTQDVAHNGTTYTTTFGLVRGANTDGIAEGSQLWLNGAGTFSATAPAKPAYQVRVGRVVREHAVNGAVFVAPYVFPKLGELSDVDTTGVVAGKSLKLNASNVWVPFTAIEGSGTTNYIPKFTAGSTVGNSRITDDGTNVTTPELTISGLTASRAVYADANKKLASSTVTTTELGYLSGATSSIQTQLNGKAAVLHSSSSIVYGVGSPTEYGHVKLYTSTGTSTDGAMDRNSVTTALSGKAATATVNQFASGQKFMSDLNVYYELFSEAHPTVVLSGRADGFNPGIAFGAYGGSPVDAGVVRSGVGGLTLLTNVGVAGSLTTMSGDSTATKKWILQAYTGGNYSAIYNGGVTPSSTNYSLIANNTSTQVNATTGVYLNIADTPKVSISSTLVSTSVALEVGGSITSDANNATSAKKLVLRPYSTGASASCIYNGSVTPSATNYALFTTATTTETNATTSVSLNIANAYRLFVDSTSIRAIGSSVSVWDAFGDSNPRASLMPDADGLGHSGIGAGSGSGVYDCTFIRESPNVWATPDAIKSPNFVFNNSHNSDTAYNLTADGATITPVGGAFFHQYVILSTATKSMTISHSSMNIGEVAFGSFKIQGTYSNKGLIIYYAGIDGVTKYASVNGATNDTKSSDLMFIRSGSGFRVIGNFYT